MISRASALADLPASSEANARAVLSEHRNGSILQITAWPNTDGRVRTVITELLELRVPLTGSAVVQDGATVAAIAPGRYLVASGADDLSQRFQAALGSADGSVTDLTHGRTIFRLHGDVATAVLAKGVALDLDLAAFPPGRVAQTMMHHVDVVVHRLAEQSFELWTLRSFAEALGEWLLEAGLEFGVVFTGDLATSSAA